MTPTPKLRFVERNDPVTLNGERFDNWQKILQQWWEYNSGAIPDGEWRDVPIEKEQA
jgi:hypothetical protein